MAETLVDMLRRIEELKAERDRLRAQIKWFRNVQLIIWGLSAASVLVALAVRFLL